MALKKARVLREISIEGKSYQPNSVLLLDEKQIKTYESDGSVAGDAAAVEYCEKELGAKAERPGRAAAADAAG